MAAMTKEELVSYLQQHYLHIFYDTNGDLYSHSHIANRLKEISHKYYTAYRIISKYQTDFYDFPCIELYTLHAQLHRNLIYLTTVLLEALPPKIVINARGI